MSVSRNASTDRKIDISGLTLVQLCRAQARSRGEDRLYTFLLDGAEYEVQLTYAGLDRWARRIGAFLQSAVPPGERALLMAEPGLDYIAGFFGCLYGGIVPVPVCPPRSSRLKDRIERIVTDAHPRVALTTTATQSHLRLHENRIAPVGPLQWVLLDSIDACWEASWRPPAIDESTVALIQYTSGSTGSPRGVLLTHHNLLYNQSVIYDVFKHSSDSVMVAWVPPYHDLGLIGAVMQPLFGGFPCVLMPPAVFLQRPFRWLHAISRFKATISGGPNFAYELCAARMKPAERASLDLSSWRVAITAAEPVRRATLERFAAAFAPAGFRPEAFFPCYGLAEATLMVSGGVTAHRPSDGVALSAVTCGHVVPDSLVLIVDPNSRTELAPGRVGEIWIKGPGVAKGYWNRPDEMKEVFGAHLENTGEGPFLRSGDLGFIQDGELYITGRLKDLIIIKGRNHYPEDIEETVKNSHDSLKDFSGAAFSIEFAEEERLVVVHEIECRIKPEIEAVAGAICGAVAERHDVRVGWVAFIKPGRLPRTSSGKIQRGVCRDKLLAGALGVLWERSALQPFSGPRFEKVQ